MLERRIHRVFVTKNREYHIRRKVCVAVRDRESGAWLARHDALHERLAGALVFTEGGVTILLRPPVLGECMVFTGPGTVTTPVLSTYRPARAIVELYGRLGGLPAPPRSIRPPIPAAHLPGSDLDRDLPFPRPRRRPRRIATV